MTIIYAFLLSGLFCMIGQIIIDNTKLTAGHVTSLFTVLGAILSFFGIYEYLIDYAGSGATSLILNFGHSLYKSGISGYKELGIIGIFSNLLTKSSTAISAAVIFSFIFTIICKPKN